MWLLLYLKEKQTSNYPKKVLKIYIICRNKSTMGRVSSKFDIIFKKKKKKKKNIVDPTVSVIELIIPELCT